MPRTYAQTKGSTGGGSSGAGGNGLVVTATKTANYTAVASDLVICDTSGGAFTVTLPASPTTGDRIGIFLNVAGNTVTIDRNGKLIDGVAANTQLGLAISLRTLQYNGTQWLTVEAE